MKYGDLTYQEIAERVAAGWLALVPTGCTEQQGPHLPVDFDTWFAETLLLAASEAATRQYGVESLVLPALPFGPTPEHRSFGTGYIDLPAAVHDAVLEAILASLAAQGFQRILIWRGCGGHNLHAPVERFNTQQGRARAFLSEMPYYAIWRRVGDAHIATGHADSFTTSIMLHLRPEAVRLDHIVDPQSQEPDWTDPQLDFGRYSATGVVGDPTHSSAAVGAQLWQECVAAAAREIQAASAR
jgi:creatinine amidohydrolase/Fe(II)-dependent formamide hydrolase-like protein